MTSFVAAVLEHDNSDAVLACAVSIARQTGSTLRLIGLARPVPRAVACSPTTLPFLTEQLREQALDEVAGCCRTALGAIPADVMAEYRVVCDRPHKLVAEIAADNEVGHLVLHEHCVRRGQMRRVARSLQDAGVTVHLTGPHRAEEPEWPAATLA
jgi:hypothetical protein